MFDNARRSMLSKQTQLWCFAGQFLLPQNAPLLSLLLYTLSHRFTHVALQTLA